MREFQFLTNNFRLAAIAAIDTDRWAVELFSRR